MLAIKEATELYPDTNPNTTSRAASPNIALLKEIFRINDEYSIVPPNPKQTMDIIPLSVAKKG